MKVEVSNGEIFDKFSILEIKLSKIDDEDKLINIQKEYDSLKEPIEQIRRNTSDESKKLDDLHDELLNINNQLWEIEDKIREKERNSEFDDEFISLARNVYFTNDKRSLVKKDINKITKSVLIEEKSYKKYDYLP